MPSKRDVLALFSRDELLVVVDRFELAPRADSESMGVRTGKEPAGSGRISAYMTKPYSVGGTPSDLSEYAPCPSCRGAMNQAAGASGARIIYSWPGGVFVAGGE